MTGLILFVAAASLFAVILGYSRVPFAAVRDGDSFARDRDAAGQPGGGCGAADPA